jgi:hypothetical protein
MSKGGQGDQEVNKGIKDEQTEINISILPA